MPLKYKRVLLKLSGEALAGDGKFGINDLILLRVCTHIKESISQGAQVAVVVGGGNYFRGRSSGAMDRVRADQIGMLATVMNAIWIADTLLGLGVPAKVMTASNMEPIGEFYMRDKAVDYMEKGYVVVFGGGTGSPFFSTDTTAALRAAEIGADVLMKATMVDGVYDKDPNKFSDARKYDTLTWSMVISDGLQVLDTTAAAMCRENGIPMLVFDMSDPLNIVLAIQGEQIGTIVKEDL